MSIPRGGQATFAPTFVNQTMPVNIELVGLKDLTVAYSCCANPGRFQEHRGAGLQYIVSGPYTRL